MRKKVDIMMTTSIAKSKIISNALHDHFTLEMNNCTLRKCDY